MPGKNDLGDFIGDLHIEVHENGIRTFSRETGREAWDEEKITVDDLEDFIINMSNKDEFNDAETIRAINKEVEEIERKNSRQ